MYDIHAVPQHPIRTPEAETTEAPGHQPAGAPAVPPTGAPQAQPLVDETLLGRLGNKLSRTGARLRASKFDISPALSQTSQHGKPFAPADFTANGERYSAKPVVASNAAGTPLAKSERQTRQALGKTARSSSASSSSAARLTAEHGNEASTLPLDAM